MTLMTPAKQDGDRFDKIMEKTRRRIKEVKTAQDSRLVSDVKLQWVMNTLQIKHEDFSTNFIAGGTLFGFKYWLKTTIMHGVGLDKVTLMAFFSKFLFSKRFPNRIATI